MFYLKYRPESLSTLDSPEVAEKLRAVLSSKGAFPHALLFSGPKGTGKTSTARIVAKILNAPENKKGTVELEPQNDSPELMAISQGTSSDVYELDAASNRKIDDIRALIDQLKFAPLSSKYKVYIIDEVHMLTKEAFNALLKSLEEPPAHTIFILATTEKHMLPATIVSRCVEVTFSRASTENVKRMLERIVKSEKLPYSEDVLEYIATRAGGSFRDAAKNLEMLSLTKHTTLPEIITFFGGSSEIMLLAEYIAQKDAKKALEFCNDHEKKGVQFIHILEELAQIFRKQLLFTTDVADADYKSTSPTSITAMTQKDCIRILTLLQKAIADMKFTPIQSLPLECAIVDFSAQKA